MRLIITNGDSAAATLRAGGITDPIVCWRDVLHEGPVRPDLDLAALSAERAAFITSAGWGADQDVAAEFTARDHHVLSWRGPVTIALEHDLYDQLQLLQILDLYASGTATSRDLRLAQANDYLGEIAPAAAARLIAAAEPIDGSQLELAELAWGAFRAPAPRMMVDLLARDLGRLPHLASALWRLLEELPSPRDGLARSERQALEELAKGSCTGSELFSRCAHREPARFMGDMVFWWRVAVLAQGSLPLIAGWPRGGTMRDVARAQLMLTGNGHRTLAGQQDALRCIDLDRWLGGTHLRAGTVWRWDASRGMLAAD